MLYLYIYQPEFQANCLSLRLSRAHPSLSLLVLVCDGGVRREVRLDCVHHFALSDILEYKIEVHPDNSFVCIIQRR